MTPSRLGSQPHSFGPRARTIRRACWTSRRGTDERPRGRRYRKTAPVMPCSFSHLAIPCPSGPITTPPYPPPGQITITAPLGFAGLWTVMTAFLGSKVPSPFGALPPTQRGTVIGSDTELSGAAERTQMGSRTIRLIVIEANFMISLVSTSPPGSKTAQLRSFELGDSSRIPVYLFCEVHDTNSGTVAHTAGGSCWDRRTDRERGRLVTIPGARRKRP